MENKSYLLKGAMTYGLIMGIYWAAKYIFFILSLSVPTMSVVYLALTLVVPVLAYHIVGHGDARPVRGEKIIVNIFCRESSRA